MALLIMISFHLLQTWNWINNYPKLTRLVQFFASKLRSCRCLKAIWVFSIADELVLCKTWFYLFLYTLKPGIAEPLVTWFKWLHKHLYYELSRPHSFWCHLQCSWSARPTMVIKKCERERDISAQWQQLDKLNKKCAHKISIMEKILPPWLRIKIWLHICTCAKRNVYLMIRGCCHSTAVSLWSFFLANFFAPSRYITIPA